MFQQPLQVWRGHRPNPLPYFNFFCNNDLFDKCRIPRIAFISSIFISFVSLPLFYRFDTHAPACGVFAESGTPHVAHRICFIIMSPSSHRLIFDAFHHSDIRFARLDAQPAAKFDSQLVPHECKKILRDCAANRVHNQNGRNFKHVAEVELVERRRREREKKCVYQINASRPSSRMR